MTIIEALSNIQNELIAPKNQYNAFGKYKYRSCEDILQGLKEPLEKYNACVTLEDDIVMVGDRIYVKATATLLIQGAEGEETISSTAFAREPENKKGQDESQITGATSSYARKYALNGLFAIDDEKDADSRDNKDNADNKPKKITTAQIKDKIKGMTPEHIEKVLKSYKVPGIENLNECDLDNWVEF